MPRAAATKPSPQDTCHQIAALLASAMQFVARERGEATVRKWLARRDIEEMSEDRMLTMAADAVLLSADLLLSQPAGSGTTAFDRLARSRADAPAAEAAAITAVRRARFRLLRLEGDTQTREVLVRDVLSDEELRVVGTELPPLTDGTMLFGRAVKRWLGESAQVDKWLFCLSAARMPRIRSRHVETHTTEPQRGFQGQGGSGRDQG